MKRFAALLLIFALVIPFAGCEEGVPVEPPVSEAVSPDTDTPVSEIPSPVDSYGESIVDLWNYPIAEINGETVLASELRFQIVSILGTYMQYSGDIDWSQPISGVPAAEFFVTEALKNVKTFRAVEMLANYYGVSMTDEERAELENEIFSYAEESYGSIDAFSDLLAADGMTLDLYLYVATVPELYYKVYDFLYVTEGAELAPTDAEIRDHFHQNYLTTQHIMASLFDDSGYVLSDEEISAKHDILDSALARYNAGEDFGALVMELSEYAEDETTMTFHPDEIMDEYVNIVEALQPGENSAVEEIAGTVIIIRRMPLNEEYLDENIVSITSQYTAMLFTEQIEDCFATMDIDLYDAYYAVDVEAIYNEYM